MIDGGGRPAVFFDRDGTINVEVNYLHRIDDLVLVPGAAAAIRAVNRAGYQAILVTNQAGIARGYYDEAALRTLHAHLAEVLAAADARLDAIYFCPHHPDFGGACECRKPAPGMLLRAAAEHHLDLRRSWLVGDTLGDLGAGRAVGCRTVLVRTGYGARAEAELIHAEASVILPRPDAIVDDVGAAVRYLLQQDQRQAGAGLSGAAG